MKNNNIIDCCIGFESSHKRQNKKGISIKKEFSIFLNDYEFYLQFRAVDLDKQEILRDAFKIKLLGMKLPNLSLQGEVKINYCPWCGAKL